MGAVPRYSYVTPLFSTPTSGAKRTVPDFFQGRHARTEFSGYCQLWADWSLVTNDSKIANTCLR